VTFNPFSITRKTDRASPLLFQMACSGTPFETVTLALRKSTSGATASAAASAVIFLRFDFKLVAVKKISWSSGDESPKEQVTFEYGGLQVRYSQQTASGALAPPVAGGWNRVKNIQDLSAGAIAGS
jgi:type VI secretion system secreted protein Hcp